MSKPVYAHGRARVAVGVAVKQPSIDGQPLLSGAKWTRTAGPPGPRTGSHAAV